MQHFSIWRRSATTHHLALASMILVGLLALAAFFPGQPTALAQAGPQSAGPAAATRVYLPMLQGGRGTQPPPPPPPPSAGRFFLQRESWTNRARVAVDRAGGVHLAYISAEPGPTSPAFYAYCPPGGACARAADFRTVTLSDKLTDIQLALTPDGRPRLMLERDAATTIGEFGVIYDYAVCERDCTSAAQWAFARVATSSYIDINRVERPWRTFALDGLARPHFLYYSGRTSFYVTCLSDCLEAAGWVQTALTLPSGSGGDIPRLSLAVTSAGQPHLFGEVFTDEEPGAGLYYMTCAAACTSSADWSRTKLLPIDTVVVAQHDLEVTSAGGLRGVALVYRTTPDGPFPKKLFYLVCAADCLDAENWLADTVGLGENDGEHAELELDAQGRPRIAYLRSDGGGLGFLWCDVACETDQAIWRVTGPDTSTLLEQELESYELDSCQKGVWGAGWMPALAFDPQGNPRIASEALQLVRCFAKPEPSSPLISGINTLRYTRFVTFPMPSSGG